MSKARQWLVIVFSITFLPTCLCCGLSYYALSSTEERASVAGAFVHGRVWHGPELGGPSFDRYIEFEDATRVAIRAAAEDPYPVDVYIYGPRESELYLLVDRDAEHLVDIKRKAVFVVLRDSDSISVEPVDDSTADVGKAGWHWEFHTDSASGSPVAPTRTVSTSDATKFIGTIGGPRRWMRYRNVAAGVTPTWSPSERVTLGR